MSVDSLQESRVNPHKYNHAQHEPMRRFLRFLLKWIGFTALAKIDKVEGLENIPQSGPAILMINHIALIDPILVLHLAPRNIVPMAKIEVYDYPFIGIFPKLWGVIPVRRDEVDRHAIQQVLQVLDAGEIVLLAPEATRSPALKKGKEGVAYIASRTQTPVIPIAVSGTVGFPTLPFTKAWKQPGATVKVGRPFVFRKDLRRAGREQLRQMMDESMYVLASLLPVDQRGVYQDLSKATQDTIEWL
jgi:1-acyl-sn-glycerol-3-phosphate acyltransferase